MGQPKTSAVVLDGPGDVLKAGEQASLELCLFCLLRKQLAGKLRVPWLLLSTDRVGFVCCRRST